MKGLDSALTDVRDFLSENREAMGVTFDRLSSITTALNDSRMDIKQILHVAPTVFQNFLNIYQPAQSAMTGIIALNNFADIPQWICSSIEAASRARLDRVSKLCLQYINPIIKTVSTTTFRWVSTPSSEPRPAPTRSPIARIGCDRAIRHPLRPRRRRHRMHRSRLLPPNFPHPLSSLSPPRRRRLLARSTRHRFCGT